MKPKNLKCPFTWETRRPILTEGVLFVPQYYQSHAEWGVVNFEDPNVFKRSCPVVVEYCSGNGAWIIEKAQQHPEWNWVAVEKRFDRVRKIWSKARNLKLDNLLVVCGEALEFTRFYLPSECFSSAYINFPDPWPKEKHAKHRIFQESFISEMSRVVRKEGIATVVTDDPIWAERISEAMQKNPQWRSQFPEPYFVTEWPDYGSSYFNDLWLEKGRTIHYMQFINKTPS
ncbi:MAG: tRNA (guanine(46)-N(7))-methyltransferase TrmB [Rhabdochlamydiaceae bacterium]|nr:tRNA (guanine(46)-N(7))-methyltransferase TrmB [Rhabdochlamydiaceae bacterium]